MNLDSFFEHLQNEGFRPSRDKDDDIYFKYQGMTVCIDSYADDSEFLRVMIPNIWSIDSEDERELALRSANDVNFRLKAVKIFVHSGDDVHVSIEFFAPDPDAGIAVLHRCFSILYSAVNHFREGMHKGREMLAESGEEEADTANPD